MEVFEYYPNLIWKETRRCGTLNTECPCRGKGETDYKWITFEWRDIFYV